MAAPDVMPDQGATTVRRLALVPILSIAFLYPSVASALGLGEIDMQSALNQRLDAEIPLRGVEADQVDDIIVTLASEKAFQNVGLRRPYSLTKLRFAVKHHSGGSYYVQVSSTDPIVEPFLSFLVEVDWPGGNLLREYTVLLDPPVFATEKSSGGGNASGGAAAPTAQSAGGSESVAASGVPGRIERKAEPAQQDTAGEKAAPKQEPEAAATQEKAAATGEAGGESAAGGTPEASGTSGQAKAVAAAPSGDFGDTPVFLQVEQKEEAADRQAERAAAQASTEKQKPAKTQAYETASQGAGTTSGSGGTGTGAPSKYGPVERGETLWNIATRMKQGDMTVQQMMLALLRYNPDAFVDGNVNRLKQGYVLRVPKAAEVRSLSAQQAVAQVREQNALWRQWRNAARSAGTRSAEARKSTASTASTSGSSGATEERSRLTIVGSNEGGASSDEAASATANSSKSASQQLKLVREQLESARMEKQDLADRVDGLEKTVNKMKQLITLRENQLAKLQDQLAKLQKGETAAGATAAASGAGTTGGETASNGGEASQKSATAGSSGTAEAPDENAGNGTDKAESGSATTTATESDTGTGNAGESGTAGAGAQQETSSASDSADNTGAAGDEDQASGAAKSSDETATASASGSSAGGSGASASTSSAAGNSDSAKTRPAPDRGVTTTRTQAPPKTWLDTITGTVDAMMGTVTGVLGGLAAGGAGALFAGPMSPGVLGVAVLLVLILVALLVARRRRQGAPEPEGADTIEDISFDELGTSEEADLGRMDEGSDVIAEEFDAGASSTRGEDAPAEDDFDLGSLDGAAGDAGDDDGPRDDTVAEADVYLAYGLHQQAEDLLRLALRESPGRSDYQEKLLETLYAAGNRDDFVAEAEKFRSTIEEPQDRSWQRVVAMGRELAPDHELFQDAVAPDVRPEELQRARPATADIELDAGDDNDGLDFAFEGDESGDGSSSAEEEDEFSRTVMLDSGDFDAFDGDGGLVAPEAEAPDEGDGGAGHGITQTAAGGEADEIEFDLGDFDELTASEERPEARQQTGNETAAGSDAPGAPREQDDALEFDLSDLDTGGGEDTGDSGEPETRPASRQDFDEGLDFDIDLGGEETGGGEEPAERTASGAPTSEDDDPEATTIASPDLDLGDLDLESDPLSGFEPGENTGESTAASDDETALGATGLDEIPGFGDADDTGESRPGARGNGETVNASSGDETAWAAVDFGDEGEADLGVGSDGEDDEFDTMLDLARAYIDMGDTESANNALEEVIAAGSDKQRHEAKGLLESVQ